MTPGETVGQRPGDRRSFDLVVFDLDGTLVDSAPDIAWALNAALSDASVPALSLETVTTMVGDGAAKLIERALSASASGHATTAPAPGGQPASDPAALLARFLAHYADHVCVGTRLYPGIVDCLDDLAAVGTRLAVFTNKPHALAHGLLQQLGIAERFAVVIGDGDGYPRKPNPNAARAIITRLGTTPARTIVVGDGLPDVRMAHAVPCRIVASAWGYVARDKLIAESPTFIAGSPQEAAQILATL